VPLTERRREPWPWVIVTLLALMMVGSISFFAIAVSHPDPVVVDDAYAAGLRYNETRAARDRGRDSGLEIALRTEPVPAGLAVTLEIRDPSGARVPAESVTLRRERPAEGGHDREIAMRSDGGAYAADVPLPLPGRWTLVANAVVNGVHLERAFSVERPR